MPAWREVAARLVRANREAIVADRAEAAELDTLRAGLRQAADAARLWPAVWQACAGDEGFRRGLAGRVPQG